MFLSFIKRFSLLMMVFAMTLFVSCKEEKSKTPAEDGTTTSETIQNNTEGTNSTKGDVALNPPHGQPGHRCDIKVGDPLPDGSTSSPVIKSQQSPVIKNTGNVPVNSSNTNTTTSGNVNPAHGQPGHRCDIPVGAPLD